MVVKPSDVNNNEFEAISKSNVLGLPARESIYGLDSIKILLDSIISKWNPKQVWLFGSRARGDAKVNSDWDVFVVVDDSMPDEEFDPLVAWELREKSGIRADIFLCHSSDFKMCKNTPNTLSYSVESEGVLIYGG